MGSAVTRLCNSNAPTSTISNRAIATAALDSDGVTLGLTQDQGHHQERLQALNLRKNVLLRIVEEAGMRHGPLGRGHNYKCPFCGVEDQWLRSKDDGEFKCRAAACLKEFSFSFCARCNEYGDPVRIAKGQGTVTCNCGDTTFDAMCIDCGKWCTFSGEIERPGKLRHGRCPTRFTIQKIKGRYCTVPYLLEGEGTRLRVKPIVMGEGESRFAYAAQVSQVESKHQGNFNVGDQVVVKVLKPRIYNLGVRLSAVDITMHTRARRMAHEFTSTLRPNRGGQPVLVAFLPTMLWTACQDVRSASGTQCVKKGEHVLVERLLRGTFRKFNSNSGWCDDTHTLLQFFSHWTYAQSQGQELLCDLQGVAATPGNLPQRYRVEGVTYEHYYMLTDPAIISVDQRYGITDLGPVGLREWFAGHTCNRHCRSHGIADIVPPPPAAPPQPTPTAPPGPVVGARGGRRGVRATTYRR